ncbi:MAG TPA: hypothetical protein VJT12_00230 [Methyloceanibacter sp.]|jgi:hypothetical protein|nr:hypothetical protein [Methyloceanibacter sp.]
MRISGFWRRALIVVAAIWIVIGGSFGWNHAYDNVDTKFKQCVTAMKSAADLQACRDARNGALAVPRGVAAAIIAFGPLLVLWLAFYALRRLGRWAKRGAPAPAPLDGEPGAG